MALLRMAERGTWLLEIDAEPLVFWPYTTIVTDVVMSGPREEFNSLHQELIKMFNEAGIKAYEENKSAFGVKDFLNKVWYLGFKDGRFDLGMGIRPDSWINPVRRPNS